MTMANDATESHLTPEFEERAREELDRLQIDLLAINLKLMVSKTSAIALLTKCRRWSDCSAGRRSRRGTPRSLRMWRPHPPARKSRVRRPLWHVISTSHRWGRRLESRFRRRQFRRRGDALSVAMEVLREAQQPLHYVELTKRMLDSGKWTTSGDTPSRSVNLACVDGHREQRRRLAVRALRPRRLRAAEWGRRGGRMR